ncbi:MAG: cytochrome c oxidase assembly protein [Alphaproteobacteria bacterium]|nr:cytochrome c oxidase assembly protein [Alphaproteobacteria bacterium]
MSKNVRLFIILFCVALAMLGFGYAFVPLYKVFCDFVGIPQPSVLIGKEGVPKPMPKAPLERTVVVRFMANTEAGLPVEFAPVERVTRLNIGQNFLTAYEAKNISNEGMAGVAVHTVSGQGVTGGEDMSAYIDLQQCFCFEEQYYPAGEDINLPLQFFITADLPKEVHTLVFGYTLFEQPEN